MKTQITNAELVFINSFIENAASQVEDIEKFFLGKSTSEQNAIKMVGNIEKMEQDLQRAKNIIKNNFITVPPVVISESKITNHLNFLTKTLIPDLKQSGTTSTAKDFELCVKIINQLLNK